MYLTAFDLNYNPYHYGYEYGVNDEIGAGDKADEPLLPTVWDEVGEVAERHQGEYIAVAVQHLHKQLRMEIGEDLQYHVAALSKCAVSEEYPCQANEMEGYDHGKQFPYTMTDIVLVVTEDIPARELVYRKRYTVHAAPCHEVQTRPVPQAAKQHRKDEVDVCADGALAVAAETDVNIVAYPC